MWDVSDRNLSSFIAGKAAADSLLATNLKSLFEARRQTIGLTKQTTPPHLLSVCERMCGLS